MTDVLPGKDCDGTEIKSGDKLIVLEDVYQSVEKKEHESVEKKEDNIVAAKNDVLEFRNVFHSPDQLECLNETKNKEIVINKQLVRKI